MSTDTINQTNIPKFRTTQYRDVRRTHPEFVRLAEHLMSANPEAIVPAVPPPLTPAGAGTEEDEVRVKASMQRWLTTVLDNEVLIHDDEVVLFVESDFGYSPVVRMKQPATGMRRKVLKQFAPPPDDNPELQSARPAVKMFYLGAMDTSHKVDKIVKGRRGTWTNYSIWSQLEITTDPIPRTWLGRNGIWYEAWTNACPRNPSGIGKCVQENRKNHPKCR